MTHMLKGLLISATLLNAVSTVSLSATECCGCPMNETAEVVHEEEVVVVRTGDVKEVCENDACACDPCECDPCECA